MTSLEKKGPQPGGRFPWGHIVDVHVVGTYALVEYMSSRPGNSDAGWKSERMFSGYVHQPQSRRADARGWMDIGQSYHSLEAGLAGVVAHAAGFGDAALYFMKMIAPAAAPAAAPEKQKRKLRIEDAVGVSRAEVVKALKELHSQGQGTALDLPAAVLMRLRDRIDAE